MKFRISFLLVIVMFTVMSISAYTIYPVPHYQMVGNDKATFTSEVAIVTEQGIDQVTIDRAKQVLAEHGLMPILSDKPLTDRSALFLGVSGSRGVADIEVARRGLDTSVFSLPKYDRHIIELFNDDNDNARIVILGENTDAVFCALASVEQILDNGTDMLSVVVINDYADVSNRGIIEGYYGVPYSAEVTKDLFRFMARYKLNTYMYGAKSDVYHSAKWNEPYPTHITPDEERIGYLTQDMLKQITQVAHATKVNFIWAIHPGRDFTDTTKLDVNERIMSKFEAMHDLGVRQFGVFVDDVGVPADDKVLNFGATRLSELQHLIDNKWNRVGAIATDTVKPLHYVPQLYAYGWVDDAQAKRFFESLTPVPEKVNIYITGRKVWSVPNSFDLAKVKQWLGRDLAWWWNYPCNDQDMTKLFPADTYTNFRDEKHIANLARLDASLTGTKTVIINPMQQGEVSKIALFSVADYAWNTAAFNNEISFNAALPAVVGDKYAANLAVVIPYLRYFDNDALAYIAGDYKNVGLDKLAKSLLPEMKRLYSACVALEQMKDDPDKSISLFYEDVRPWLTKLRDMTSEAISLLTGEPVVAHDFLNDEAYRFPVLHGMGSEIHLGERTAEPSAQVLMPLIVWIKENHD